MGYVPSNRSRIFICVFQLEAVFMNRGCCLYCAHAASYWIDGAGNKHVPPKTSFGDMNIYCLHESRAPGECYPISFARCTRFKRAQDDQIQRRRAFYSQFERWHTHAQMIAQRR